MANTDLLAVSQIKCKPCWVGITLVNPVSGTKVVTKHVGWEDSGPGVVAQREMDRVPVDGGIEVIRSDGSDRHVVRGTSSASSPAWSSDGGHLTFVQMDYVWTARTDGGGRRPLAKGREPAWSPNGRLIAYVLPNGGIATIPAGGGKSRTLSPGLAPAWSPDSSRIAYTRWPPSNEFSVWLMNANGTGRRLVMLNAREASWRP